MWFDSVFARRGLAAPLQLGTRNAKPAVRYHSDVPSTRPQKWTEQEITLLQEGLREGETLKQIYGRFPDRSRGSVTMQAFKFRDKVPVAPKRWTAKETELLLKLYNERKTFPEIKEHFPDRSLAALRIRAWASRRPASGQLPWQKWTQTEELLLIKMLSEGKRISEISQHFPSRSLQSIHMKVSNVRHLVVKASSKHYWTKEESLRLQEAKAAGKSWSSIKELFPSRTAKALQQRWVDLRRAQRGPKDVGHKLVVRDSWSREEIDQLYRLRKVDQLPYKEVAIKLGRSVPEVKSRMVLMRQPTWDNLPQNSVWTEDEVRKLRRLRAAGVSAKDIASQLECSVEEVETELHRRLNDKYHFWTPEEREKLRSAMDKGLKLSQIRDLFPNRTQRSLANRIYMMRADLAQQGIETGRLRKEKG